MEKETYEMFQAILSGIGGMEKRFDEKLDCMEKRFDEKLEGEIRGIKLLIENDVGKRIEALFDGYKLVHEKQWELERKVEKLTERLERLEAKAK